MVAVTTGRQVDGMSDIVSVGVVLLTTSGGTSLDDDELTVVVESAALSTSEIGAHCTCA